MTVAYDHSFRSIAFPLIGAGSGGFAPDRAKAVMLDEIQMVGASLHVILVLFKTR
jgi:O-acetyl-ADP-ribose deacetylase (regulator of RNase III)